MKMNAEDITTVIRSITMCSLAFILTASLCATLFWKNYADPSVLVTIVGLAGTAFGYLAGKRSPEPTNGKPDPEPTQNLNVF
jgi:hypothetical protein